MTSRRVSKRKIKTVGTVQVWHERAADDDTELTEEKALNDMPHKQEL